MRLMLFFDGRYPRRAWPVLAEYIRPNVYPRKSNSPSGTLQMRVSDPQKIGHPQPQEILSRRIAMQSLRRTQKLRTAGDRSRGNRRKEGKRLRFPCCGARDPFE